MNEIFSQMYWDQRFKRVEKDKAPLHHTVYCVGQVKWDACAERHKELLKSFIRKHDSVLDVGCGYGRLLDLLPDHWQGRYVGIDLSWEMINHARATYRHWNKVEFFNVDIRCIDLPFHSPREGYRWCFDVAVMISVRGMILRKAPYAWPGFKSKVRDLADRIICLEYDPNDLGVEL